MEWESEDIKKNFHGVVRDTKVLNTHDLEQKYEKFKQDHEKLYNMAIDSVLNGSVQPTLQKLNFMLKARDDMKNGNRSKLATDMLIGNQLGKEYIYPKTSTPTQEDMNRAVKEITGIIKKQASLPEQ